MLIHGSKVAMPRGRQGPKCGRCGSPERKGEAMKGVKEKGKWNGSATVRER